MKMMNVSAAKIIPYLLLVLFISTAVLLLNQNCVYTPDSAEYIILAESLFSGQGYRDLSDPGLYLRH